MKPADTISAKEIRQDLEGFLRRVKSGRPLTVIYRSKPYVTISADVSAKTADAGSRRAVGRSLATAKMMRESALSLANNPTYHELLDEKYHG